MATNEPADVPFPSLSWEQTRVLQHAFMRSALPKFEDVAEGNAENSARWEWVDEIDPAFRTRAKYFNQFGAAYSHIGALPAEMRLSIEPLHPLADAEHQQWIESRLREFGVADPAANYGLTVLSRALFTSYHPIANLFELVKAPENHDDLFLFDPLVGFVQWSEGAKVRNFWLGNQRDIIELGAASPQVKALLLQAPSDHFSLGKSLFLRLVGPQMPRRWPFVLDGAGIPTIEVESQRDLEALAADLQVACERVPADVTAVFRGQTEEYRLPNRDALVRRGVCLYSDVCDHSVVPSLYRHYDRFLNDPALFRLFITHLLDWGLYSDLVFGEPVTYRTLDGKPYQPKEVSPEAQATMTFHMAGDTGGPRALADMGPYTVWRITNANGDVLDEYVKLHTPGYDTARRNLILQHYGAPTPFIDVTRDIHVAEWFAFNRMTVQDSGLSTSGAVEPPFRDPAIFVFLALEGLTPLVDTRLLTTPEESLRPHRQACALLGGAGNLYRNAASRFIALKIKFADSFRPSELPTARHLFPGPDEDTMLARLLQRYQAPSELPKKFPVYWFPEGTPAPRDNERRQVAPSPAAVAPPALAPRGEIGSEQFVELFPEDLCQRVFAELAVWTSVDDCLAAARFIENRPAPTDAPSRVLIIPFPDNDEFQAMFIQCLGWLIQAYAVPDVKVRLAAAIDPEIAADTAKRIVETKFRASVDLGAAGTIEDLFPALAAHRADRYFVVDGDEHIVELIQNPLRCLKAMIEKAWQSVSELATLRDRALKTRGSAPRIFHQPYTDGPLFALVEALAFYVFGFDIGPNPVKTHALNRGYRSVELVGRPPFDPRLFDVARQSADVMFRSVE